MSSLADLRLPRYLGLALAYLVITTGCAGMPQPLAPLTAMLEGPPPAPTPGGKKVTFELRPEHGRPERFDVALSDDDSVDTMLTKAHISSRFGRMKINVYRPNTKPGGPIHPLKVIYDASAGHVPPEYDYHLHDGDRILVTEDPTTGFDRILNSLIGPIRGE